MEIAAAALSVLRAGWLGQELRAVAGLVTLVNGIILVRRATKLAEYFLAGHLWSLRP